MSKTKRDDKESKQKFSESTNRMARIMGVEFQSNQRWVHSSSHDSDDRKRA